MKETPAMLKTPSGYVQQSPWLSVANKQLELMGRFMTELGMTPAARTRVAVSTDEPGSESITRIEFVTVYENRDGTWTEEPLYQDAPSRRSDAPSTRIELDGRAR
jgi:hypothetical protein